MFHLPRASRSFDCIVAVGLMSYSSSGLSISKANNPCTYVFSADLTTRPASLERATWIDLAGKPRGTKGNRSGKEEIKVRTLLSHQAGMYAWREKVHEDDFHNWEHVVELRLREQTFAHLGRQLSRGRSMTRRVHVPFFVLRSLSCWLVVNFTSLP